MKIYNVDWKKSNEVKGITIGYLIYDNNWFFKYEANNVLTAISNGFRPFVEFPDTNTLYRSNQLFYFFAQRFNQREKNNYIEILENDNLKLITDNVLVYKAGNEGNEKK